MADWQELLSWDVQQAHFNWDTRGRVGPGRLVLANSHLAGLSLEGGYLHRALLRDCNLSGANLQGCGLEDAEFVSCNLDGARLGMADMDRMRIAGGSYVRTMFSLSHLDGCVVEGGTFCDAAMVRVTWDGAAVRNADLTRALMTDGRFERATFVGCSLREVDFSRSQPLPKAAGRAVAQGMPTHRYRSRPCLLYTSDAADE